MRHMTVQRGAVLFGDRQYWLLWDTATELCMPIRGQAAARSRWDHRARSSDLPGVALQFPLVCAGEARTVQTEGMTLLGEMAAEGLEALATTIRRAVQSEACEARHRM